MATGYDTRQGGRDSFASQGPALERLGRGTRSGESRGVQIVGGDAVAGGAPNVQITTPGSDAEGLGSFFNELVQPYVERKQRERFFEGFTRAQSGEAIEELSKSHKGVVGQLFGPTSLEQGAQFYTAMQKVNDWSASMVDRMDELKKLPQAELSKELANTSLAMMGDDPFVNQMVQKELVEKSGPMVSTIAKARYNWQQEEAGNAMFGSLNSAATNFQKMAVANAALSDPTDDDTAAFDVSRSSFLGIMQRPEGMSDETYRGTLKAAMRSFAQQRNFYAYHALEDAGVLSLLGDEGEAQVRKDYDTYKSKALDEAKEDYVEDLLAIDEKIEKAGLGLVKYTPLQAVTDMDAVNEKISRQTGIRERAFDSGVLHTTGKRIIDVLASQAHKQQDRQAAKELKKYEHDLDKQDEEREAQQDYGAAVGAFNLAQPRRFIAGGGKESVVNQVYVKNWDDGLKHIGKFASAYKNEGYVNGDVAKIAQAQINNGGGVAYTEETKLGYQRWKALYGFSNMAAAAYYGNSHAKLLKMDSMMAAGVNETQAYLRAFSPDDAGRYTGQNLRPQDRKETMAAISSEIGGGLDGWFTRQFPVTAGAFGSEKASERAIRVATGVVTEQAAILQQSRALGPKDVAHQALGQALGNGRLEYFGGKLAWDNRAGTKGAGDIIGVSDKDTFGDILREQINDDLYGSLNIKDGYDSADFELARTPIRGGKGYIITVSLDDGRAINITSDQLKARADARARVQLKASSIPNPYRKVRGENASQRYQRINRELIASGVGF